MSVVFSGTFSGRFVADGLNKFIPLPSGVDWMTVKNETVSYAAGAGSGAEFYWAAGDTSGRGTLYTKEATIGAMVPSQLAVNAGFFLQDTSINTPGASVAITSISGAQPPVVATANTSGLIASSTMVRIFNTTGGLQLRGIDFTVGTVVANTSFTLAYAKAIAAAAGPGSYRIIPFNPIYYPPSRVITKISQATQAIITLSVTHGYLVGQKVRLVVPTVTATAFGMTNLNNRQVTIVAIGQADADGVTNTITVDFDTSASTAFAWPLTTDGDFTPAQVVPTGENTSYALTQGVNIYNDAVNNIAQKGMLLMAGAASPAGVANNVITWVAGKSFNQ